MKLTSMLGVVCVLWSGQIDASPGFTYTPPNRLGIMLDAGSTSTKMRILTWPPRSKPNQIPKITTVYSKRFEPSLDSFSTQLNGIQQYILSMVQLAQQLIPRHLHEETPIYLFMTAGARFLTSSSSLGVVDHVREVLLNYRLSPFIFKRSFARVLSGEEEGVFAWLAVNYLKGLLNSYNPDSTIGVLEMGGGSTQITFVPKYPIYANKYPLDFNDRVYGVYSHSYLNYGMRYMDIRVKRYLMRASTKRELVNPCMLKGDEVDYTYLSRKVLILGGSNWKKCEKILRYFVKTAPSDTCSPKPCAIDAVYQPLITERKFYAIAAFAFQAKNLKAINDDKTLNIEKMLNGARSFCSGSMQDGYATHSLPKIFMSSTCLMGLYIPMLLTHAYKFPLESRNIIVTNDIEGTEISWGLGALLNEIQYLDILKRAQQSKPS